MKKIICACLCVMLSAGLLAGCGSPTLETDTRIVYVDKKGAVTSLDVDSFQQDYYDEEGLKSDVDETVAVYNAANGKGAVKVESLTVEDQRASLTMKYKTAEDYSKFNDMEFYQGKVVTSLAAGYTFDEEFVKVEKGKVTGSATKQDIYHEDSLKVVIVKANIDVKVEGEICYVSSKNVKLTGSDSVSIREGYNLGDSSTKAVSETAETESIGDTQSEESVDATEIAQTKKSVGQNNLNAVSNGSFRSDVYTYIVYK